MLKYYEYLYRIRSVLKENYGIEVLNNLEKFPVDLDPSLLEYHEKIAEKIELARSMPRGEDARDRYYIHQTRPFFVRGRVYYEVTFYRAVNKTNKFDRIIAFTLIDMTDKYSAMLTLRRESIDVIGQTMPITIIRNWEVPIRPCEFVNFSKLLGLKTSVRTNSNEYQLLMKWLTVGGRNLVELIDMPDNAYYSMKEEAARDSERQLQIFPTFDKVRKISKLSARGKNVIRYLSVRMHNQTLKMVFNPEESAMLSAMRLSYGCIPSDTMPLCTSLPGHNPKYWDVVESTDIVDRKHELLVRHVKNNVESRGILYTPVKDVEDYGSISELAEEYNNNLYWKHAHRKVVVDGKYIHISGYEDETCSIVEKLHEYASLKIDGYTQSVERWLSQSHRVIDDQIKVDVLKNLFSASTVAVIYGAAGTGKSTMVDHVANYFNDKNKLFLAHTNPAIDNLKRKITAQNSEFRTISSQVGRKKIDQEYDLLVVDECSTVSNADFLKVLLNTRFKLLVLVGDTYQIESIQFGNWFEVIRAFIPASSNFELTTPYRTKSSSLLRFWDAVRFIRDDITEIMVRNGYSAVLDNTLFSRQGKDEIILCLNYDGLYGINNINRFLQSGNAGQATVWRYSTYKVGDPILFNDTERFRPLFYNNLKGFIVGISREEGKIQFDVELDRPLNAFDVADNNEVLWIRDSTVRFSVYDMATSDDDDDDSLNTIVPFQVAYAVSIHKAQGLEYDSVKVVVTDANEDDVSHSIFYTAITRARETLKIFWTPETQHSVIKKLKRESNAKDIHILSSRRGLVKI
ncbi:ATP-dependent RecD-like DNA helicase [Comamonas testosteroni]|uniref:ATP-dependent DNA helicase n=1 Tax=Comamonas testosteroni TaxID=285 RepID=UPI00389B0FE4